MQFVVLGGSVSVGSHHHYRSESDAKYGWPKLLNGLLDEHHPCVGNTSDAKHTVVNLSVAARGTAHWIEMLMTQNSAHEREHQSNFKEACSNANVIFIDTAVNDLYDSQAQTELLIHLLNRFYPHAVKVFILPTFMHAYTEFCCTSEMDSLLVDQLEVARYYNHLVISFVEAFKPLEDSKKLDFWQKYVVGDTFHLSAFGSKIFATLVYAVMRQRMQSQRYPMTPLHAPTKKSESQSNTLEGNESRVLPAFKYNDPAEFDMYINSFPVNIEFRQTWFEEMKYFWVKSSGFEVGQEPGPKVREKGMMGNKVGSWVEFTLSPGLVHRTGPFGDTKYGQLQVPTLFSYENMGSIKITVSVLPSDASTISYAYSEPAQYGGCQNIEPKIIASVSKSSLWDNKVSIPNLIKLDFNASLIGADSCIFIRIEIIESEVPNESNKIKFFPFQIY